MSNIKLISTTSLAKNSSLSPKDLFAKFNSLGFIEKNEEDSWTLTEKGISLGGEYIENKQYGRYIAWPKNIDLNNFKIEIITATKIGQHFDLSARKMNVILSEIGWTKKGLKGWNLTEQGKKLVEFNQKILIQEFHMYNGLLKY